MERALSEVAFRPPVQPNVLLVVLDTVRAKSCSVYGHNRPTTPGLERLAEDSVVFDHAIAPSTWTLPSHAAIFTGRYPTDVGVHAENMVLPESESTLAEDLTDAGYATGVFSSNPFLTEGSGLNRGFERSHTSGMGLKLFEDAFDPSQYIRTREHEQGLDKMRELLRELAGPPRVILKNLFNAVYYKYRTSRSDGGDTYDPSGDDGAAETIDAFGSWIEDVNDPFFGCLNFMEAHTPYRHRDQFLPEWATMEDIRQLDQDRWKYLSKEVELDDRRKDLFNALYEAELRYLDEQLDSLWSVLQDRNQWEDTLVIVTSDHGELLGEHDLLYHDMNRLYEPLVHVPLLVKYPQGQRGGTSVSGTTSLTRLPELVRRETIGEDTLNPEDLPQNLVKAEFVGMNQTLPSKRYEDIYNDLASPSRAVYECGTKYTLYDDQALVTQGLPLPTYAREDPERVESKEIPTHVREFGALDEVVSEGSKLNVDQAVEDRLQELGYR